MKNTIAIATLALMILLFTGCGSKPYGVALKIPPQKTEKDRERCEQAKLMSNTICGEDEALAAIIGHSNKSTYGFYHVALNNNIKAAMQTALDLGVSNKFKYMSIVYPESISNKDGSLINTVKEFMDECLFGPQDIIVANPRCDINPHLSRATFTVQFHNEVPKNRLVYNLKEEFAYFKNEGYFDDSLKENYKLINLFKRSDREVNKFVRENAFKKRLK